MPTARELLEQADALMRRNRMGSAAHAAGRAANPPTGSPTSSPAASPRTIQREPIAPSVAGTSLPVEPVEAPVFVTHAPANEVPATAPPASEVPSRAEPEVEAEFPVLTDAIEEAAAAPRDDSDDVPVLTDAVEEIDVGIVDEAARGEPSFWELTARGETSVLGPAPDSIAVVPLPDVPPVVPQLPPQGRDPLGLDQPPAGYEPIEAGNVETTQPVERADAMPLGEAEPAASDFARPEARETDWSETQAEPATPESPIGDSEAAKVAADEAQPTFSASYADGALEDAAERAVAVDGAGAESAATEATPAAPSHPSLAAASENEQRRIREIAEEIGMQVLQRIDIFTDTTLRAQLSERLRPVVERAAADLVAEINQHVGDLVRAQISEAIEREIESWRDDHR